MGNPRHYRFSLTALNVAAALVFAACAGPSTSDSADTSAVKSAQGSESVPGPDAAPSDSDPTMDDTTALIDEILALPDDERDARIAALSSDYELQLTKLSGLEEALGGPEAAAAELAAAWKGLIDQIRATAAEPIQFGLRSPAAQAAGPNLGEGLFGTIITVGMLGDVAVKASNNAEAGEPLQTQGDKETSFSGSLTEATVNVDVVYKGDKVTTTLKVQVTLSPCPDPQGHFTAKATADISAVAGPVGQNGTLNVTVDGTVDDNAEPGDFSFDYRMQWADFANSAGKFADVSGGLGKQPVVNRTGGAVTQDFARATAETGQTFGQIVAVMLLQHAETGWKSGRCVKINTTAAPGPTGMEPGSTSAVTAAPRSKVDGKPTGGTVTATLVSGGNAIDPSAAKVKADASFTYSAPDEENQGGTVALEARSKRGIGRAEITFDTKGGSYTATYDGDGISISGTVADLTKPFETAGTITGGQVTFHYAPGSAEGGSMSHNDECGPGCVAKGSGTYTVADTGVDDGTKIMTVTLHTCVTVTVESIKQEICDDKVHPILLTPA